MDTFPEPNSKQNELNSQAGQAEAAESATNKPSIQEIRSKGPKDLLKWIKKSTQLDDEDEESFLKAKIKGTVFLAGAGDRGFFQDAGLSFGASVILARLAAKTISRKSKYSYLYHGHHAASQLTVSQGTPNKPGLRNRPTPPPKNRVKTALFNCGNSPHMPVS